VGHGEELRQLFPPERFWKVPKDTPKEVSETMLTYWSNFVLTGYEMIILILTLHSRPKLCKFWLYTGKLKFPTCTLFYIVMFAICNYRDPNLPDEKLPTRWTPVGNGSDERIMYISNDGFRMEKGLARDKTDFLAYFTTSQNVTTQE